MSKYVTKTIVQLQFIRVDEGDEYLITMPEDSTALDLAYIIRTELHQGGVILSEVYIDHEFKKED